MALLQRIHGLMGEIMQQLKKLASFLCDKFSLHESVVQVAIQPGKEAGGKCSENVEGENPGL